MNRTQITNGVIGGLAGGLVFGIMMGMMGMLPMIGKMVGFPSATVGFLVHMINSAVIGAAFGAVFGRYAAKISSGVGYGIAYGGIWWLLGPLTLMPLFMGMGFGVNWNLAAATKMLPSLFGHIIYGTVLGVVYGILARKAEVGAEVSNTELSAAGE
ncbi:MAG: hypothetical protein IH931_07920 [candidate division Zixibacteria bacterium]|nr:hypothetical protein [candidate division Zixibacteria bacterium]